MMAKASTGRKPPVWLLFDGNNGVVTDAYGSGVERAADTWCKRVVDLRAQFNPTYVVAAWDSGSCFRHELTNTYKAGRKKLPGIDKAIAEAKSRCVEISVSSIEVETFEADDILATLVDAGLADGARVVIVSRDRDLHQCLKEGEVTQLIKTARVKKDGKNTFDFGWRNADSLRVEYLVRPDQWVDFKCLVGDSSDSIQGVDGIGEQLAGRLLKECGTLDNFYANPFAYKMTDRKRISLMNSKDRIPLLRQLCTLRRDVPLPRYWREAC